MEGLIILFTLIVLLFSIIIHEIAHGGVAYYLGDPTAKYSGRLTLNPLKHLDPFGSVLLPLFLFLISAGKGPIFGWTKPVPVNPYNFRDQKWGTLKVSIAGPLANFLIAIIFSLFIRFIPLNASLLTLFTIIAFYNFAWGIFNLIPIPPLDGYHILFALLPERFSKFKSFFHQYGLVFLLIFIFFGLRLIFLGAVILYTLISGQPFIL
ncbi:MAG: site-2 protease family protein [Candidatus Nealsonbacteria bacterium]